MDKKILNTHNMISWVKDNRSRFLSCDETLAGIANLDSPGQIRGKTDGHFDWKDNAEFIKKIDFKVYNGDCNYINVRESLDTPHGKIDILVTKLQVVNHLGKCIGTSGFALDITDQPLVKSYYHSEDTINLGKAFGNEQLRKQEIMILKYILIGYSAKKIARCLSLSYRTVENYIARIKHKMQCKTKGDILMACVKHGLTYVLYDAIGSIK
jgi:DNA-binding CsgD family transcriptional regulator